MNIITTKCEDCIFFKNKCTIGKDTIVHNEQIQAEGFCRIKRLGKWISDNENNKTDKLNKVIEEEKKMSMVIIAKELDIDKVVKTVESIKGGVTQIVVCTLDASKDSLSKLINYLKNSKVAWKVNNIRSETEQYAINDWYLVDRCIGCLDNSNWFGVIYEGDIISGKSFKVLDMMFASKYNNVVAFYFNENDTVRLIVNKTAFVELDGNMEMAFLDKIKCFDNWKKCTMLVP